jgi:hypothetical protein
MTTLDKPMDKTDTGSYPIERGGKLDPILGRIDLVAILTVVLGISVLAIVGMVMAVIEIVKLISSLWENSFDRWLIIILSVAIVWVAVRGKRLCVF